MGFLAAALPYITAGATVASLASQASAANRAEQAQREALARQEQLAKQGPQLSPADQALRDTLLQHFNAALAPGYSAVPQPQQDAMLGNIKSDLDTQSQKALQRLDAVMGQRGLLGSSIATQADLGVNNQVANQLQRARNDINQYAAQQTQNQRNLAQQGLASLNAQDLSGANARWQALLGATTSAGQQLSDLYGNEAKGYGDLASTLLAPYLKDFNPYKAATTTPTPAHTYKLNPYG